MPPFWPEGRGFIAAAERRNEGPTAALTAVSATAGALELEEAVEANVALAVFAPHGALRVRAWSVDDRAAHRCPPKPKSGVAES